MTSSFTTNKDLEKPANGDYVGDWEIPVNGNMDIIDKALGGVTSLSLTNANVTLTDSQAQALRIILTGSLSANIIIYFPAVGGEWLVYNNTTGSYTVTFKTVAGGSVGVERHRGIVRLLALTVQMFGSPITVRAFRRLRTLIRLLQRLGLIVLELALLPAVLSGKSGPVAR